MKRLRLKDLILFENDDFIVINKPPFISSLDDRVSNYTVINLAKEYNENCQLAHRLDKETSGVLAIAKTPEAYGHISLQFEGRSVSKIYHCVSNGVHDFDDEYIDIPLGKLNNGKVRVDYRRGKPSLTIVRSDKAFRKYTLLNCFLLTGRTHQIRVHLSQVGAPIVGDELYDGDDCYLSSLKRGYKQSKEEEERPIINRVALHAYKLEFQGLDDEEISVLAPYPKDFSVLIKQLEKYNR